MSVAQTSHLTNKPEVDGGAHFTPLSRSVLCFAGIFKKEVKRRICGHTWESNLGPPTKKAVH